MQAQIILVMTQLLTSMAMKLLTGPAMQELLLWLAQKGADSTKDWTWDNELVSIVKKHLDDKVNKE